MSRHAACAGAAAALLAFTLGGCANNIERSAKLECARLRHLATLKVARVNRKTETEARKAEAEACQAA